jgi:hypothetical protein
MAGQPSFQETHFLDGTCFGCGPANVNGLQRKSFPGPDGTMVAEFVPTPTHEAAEGIVCGGIVGTLLDCHAPGGRLPRSASTSPLGRRW